MGSPPDARETSDLQLAVAAWLETCRSANTRAAYRTDFSHFAAWCRAGEIDLFELRERDLLRYRSESEADGAGPATVARRLSAIASFSAFASDTGTARPAPHVARPGVATQSSAEVLTEDDAIALLTAADRTNPRSALLIRLLMLDGLKVGEAVRADAADVAGRPPRMTLMLRDRAACAIRLHSDTAAAVHAYLAGRREGPLLFSERRAREPDRLTRYGVDYVVKQAAEAAGLKRAVSGNTLRRRYVIAAHQRGIALDDIRRNAGHADERTTRRYLPVPAEAARMPPPATR